MGNESSTQKPAEYGKDTQLVIAAEPVVKYMSKEALQKAIENVKILMKKEAKEQNFMEAARLRDEMFALEAIYKQRFAWYKRLQQNFYKSVSTIQLIFTFVSNLKPEMKLWKS